MSDISVAAVKAYAEAAGAAASPDLAGAAGVQSPGDAFGELLGKAMSSVQGAGSTAEGAITNAALGQADLVDVVTAVAAAEATLETVVSVRDQVIRAYQEIMRMPI